MDTEDPAGPGGDTRRRAVEIEPRRVEKSALHGAQCRFEETERRRAAHMPLGDPATPLPAIAGTTALVGSTGRTAAGILALASAGLSAVLPTVDAPRRTARAAVSADACPESRAAARQHREIDLAHGTAERARRALAEPTARRDAERRGGGPQPACPPAQGNLRAGTRTYAVDGDGRRGSRPGGWPVTARRPLLRPRHGARPSTPQEPA